MRRFQTWSMLLVMALCVFMASGCGGGGGSMDSPDSEDSGNSQSQGLPNDYPDTYNMETLLEGRWRALNDAYTFNTTNSAFSFRLYSARLDFESTDIKGSVGTSLVTSNQSWFGTYTSGDTYYSLNGGNTVSLDLDFNSELATMEHQGKDSWRLEVGSGDKKVLLNIKVLSSDTLMQVRYQGTTSALYRDTGAIYDFTLNFGKEVYSQQQ